VDEFDLPGRHEWEAGSAPDHAVLWDDRRPGQLPGYFELAAHHYPGRPRRPHLPHPTDASDPASDRGRLRFAHLAWQQVAPLVAEVWGDSNR
jgi:hypothetical protein